MGEFYNQLCDGGPAVMSDKQLQHCRDDTAAMLGEIKSTGMLLIPRGATFVTWSGTANEYVRCNRTLTESEFTKAIAFGERRLARLDDEMIARGLK